MKTLFYFLLFVCLGYQSCTPAEIPDTTNSLDLLCIQDFSATEKGRPRLDSIVIYDIVQQWRETDDFLLRLSFLHVGQKKAAPLVLELPALSPLPSDQSLHYKTKLAQRTAELTAVEQRLERFYASYRTHFLDYQTTAGDDWSYVEEALLWSKKHLSSQTGHSVVAFATDFMQSTPDHPKSRLVDADKLRSLVDAASPDQLLLITDTDIESAFPTLQLDSLNYLLSWQELSTLPLFSTIKSKNYE